MEESVPSFLRETVSDAMCVQSENRHSPLGALNGSQRSPDPVGMAAPEQFALGKVTWSVTMSYDLPHTEFCRSDIADAIPFGPDFFRELLQNLYDGVYFVDCERRILFWSRSAEHLSGYSAEEVLGSFCHDGLLQHANEEGCILCRSACPLQESIDRGEPRCGRVFLRHKSGRRVVVDVQVVPVRGDNNEIVGGIEVFRDASSSLALENAVHTLKEQANKDPLTNAANRRCTDRFLAEQLEIIKRTSIPLSVVLADIDHFKNVNDRWGHAAGDAALKLFASQLQQGCRQNDLVARFGGEEFLVLMPGATLAAAEQSATRWRDSVSRIPIESLDGNSITASFGVAEATHMDTAKSLIERVDRALYRAKAHGRNCVESQLTETVRDTPH